MSLRPNVVQGLRGLFRKCAIEREMDEELSALVEASAADKLRRGTPPDEAVRAAHGNARSGLRPLFRSQRTRFETLAEFFSTLNHTDLGAPNRFVNTSSFASITEVATPDREIQLSARLSFLNV